MMGTSELIVIFFVILLLFGGKKLPELARSLGLAKREFEKAAEEITEEMAEGEGKDKQEKPAG
jgi:sec-independent protein translocase protein TatA